MTKEVLLQRVLGGERLSVVEFRSSLAEVVTFKDKDKSGGEKTFNKLQHSVESPEGAFKIDEDTRKLPGFDATKYVSPFKKGQRVVYVSRNFKQFWADGVQVLAGTGHLEPLEA